MTLCPHSNQKLSFGKLALWPTVDTCGDAKRENVATAEPPLSNPPKVSLLVLAAGRGTRLGGEEPKQYRICAGRPVLCYTLEALTVAHDFCKVTVVIHPDDRERYEHALTFLSPRCAAASTMSRC